MRVNVGQAKTELSKLLARVEAGEEVEIARNGVPVARLVKAEPDETPGEWFRSLYGKAEGQVWIGPEFEFTEAELDEIYENPIFPPE